LKAERNLSAFCGLISSNVEDDPKNFSFAGTILSFFFLCCEESWECDFSCSDFSNFTVEEESK